MLSRRQFLAAASALAAQSASPNIILALADDQGWGDTSYNGHRILSTPTLDEMARVGIRFDRFYSGAPVCSPTRGSALTGRHPYRYGIFSANADSGADSPSKYALPSREQTIAEILKPRGYTSGHFGKWHLGDFAGERKSAPTDNGFDEFFSTTRKVATVDPEGYWTAAGRIHGIQEGDDSRVLMDRAIDFIERAAARKQPFLAVIWFHAPHEPVLATQRHRAPYSQYPMKTQHFYGAIAALDEQMGRLRETLRHLKIERNTMLWYASDNGPEGDAQVSNSPGNSGPFRGRKRSLFEGGIRVPALLEWPARLPAPRVIKAAASTSDYMPTICAALGIAPPKQLDGINLLPILDGKRAERNSPLGFETIGDSRGSQKLAWIEDRWKLLSNLNDTPDSLFDLLNDPSEKIDLIAKHSEIAHRLRGKLADWRASCTQSRSGL
ncbi:MAG: N-acetylgalactosamine 6-sulfate sulfatase [Acidobacteria bacterium]|nr:N-acetylgalactosamine 6-sulfate sulfatase [Acidobacteriota bacterium]